MLIYHTTESVPVSIDREVEYESIDKRELELLLSLLNIASSKVRRELRRRVAE